MTSAERQRRYRVRVKALRYAATQPADQNDQAAQANGSVVAAPPAERLKGPADYPRMLYHPDGRTTIAATPEQHAQLASSDGWVTAPLAVHRQLPVTHHGILGAETLFARPFPRW